MNICYVGLPYVNLLSGSNSVALIIASQSLGLKKKKRFASVIPGPGLIRILEKWPTRGLLAQGR